MLSALTTLALLGSAVFTVSSTTLANSLYSNSFGIPGVNATYDYVVIGGGTAGLAIAARLAEDPANSVAVVEAGGFYQIDNGNGSVIPGLCITQYTGSDPDDTQPLIDWGFVTVPQAGAANRSMHYARGKTLGGSSARNYMAYHRGTNGSYQLWADLVGDQSYTYPNFLKYFQKSAHVTGPRNDLRYANGSASYNPAPFNNTIGGPLKVSFTNFAIPLGSWAAKGLATIGIAFQPLNFNSGILTGWAWTMATITPDKQHRASSQNTYLDQAVQTTTIKIYTQALAKQITFSSNKTANGVLVQTGGRIFKLSAQKEVILSAGAFQSPQLLMVSGIGPGQTLQNYNISVISDLPGVGQDLWDQPLFGPVYRVNVPTSSLLTNDPEYAADAAQQYLANATGPLTAPPELLAWEKIPSGLLSNATVEALSQFPSDWPQVEYLVQNGYTGYNRNYRDVPADGYNYASIAAAVVSPLSRGNVTISSSDTSDPPVINPNWLTHPADVDLAIAAFKRIRQMWPGMANITIGPEYLPGPNVTTDEEILHFIRESVVEIYHASVTCKMGMKNDTMAVVDPQARVYGVQNLRVVDASAFPLLPPGHPQGTIYALAEKIADDIRSGR